MALCHFPPCLTFHAHSIALMQNITVLPKVVSEFHIISEIILLDFLPNPQTDNEYLLCILGIKWALLVYLDRTKGPDRL